MDLNSSIVGIIALFVIAGGGIVVIDALIIRKIRRLGPPSAHAHVHTDLEEPSDDAVG